MRAKGSCRTKTHHHDTFALLRKLVEFLIKNLNKAVDTSYVQRPKVRTEGKIQELQVASHHMSALAQHPVSAY
jgi:hypothetical protein